MFVLPEWSLQYAEEACKLRDDQTLNAAVFTSQPEQISHQRLHLQRQTNKKNTFNEEWFSCGSPFSITGTLLKSDV